MPKALETHWLTTYKQMRGDYDPDIIGEQRKAHQRATQFYLDNQDIMDDGAEVAWHFIPLEDGEVSAIQHAMNIMCDDGEEVFSSECQNEPKRATQAGTLAISKDEILDRYSSFDRYVLPQGTAAVVAHCDVHDSVRRWLQTGGGLKGHQAFAICQRHGRISRCRYWANRKTDGRI
jgi:hypothetical protein